MNTKSGANFEWTSEAISSFWDSVATDEFLSEYYFTKFHSQYIEFIAKLFCQIRPYKSKLLDYGCGAGFLSRHMLINGYDTVSLDYSKSSCEHTKALLNGLNAKVVYSQSTPSPLTDQSFDLVLSIETLEHLRDEWIDSYFEELHRLIRPGGYVLITTPFAEVLGNSRCICPNCHAKFHRWGHLRSVTDQDLSAIAAKHGFSIVLSQGLDIYSLNSRFLHGNKQLIDYSLPELFDSFRNRLIRKYSILTKSQTSLNRLKLSKGDYLFFIGQKQ